MQALEGDRIWIHCEVNYRDSALLCLYHRLVEKQTAEQTARVMSPSWERDPVCKKYMALVYGPKFDKGLTGIEDE